MLSLSAFKFFAANAMAAFSFFKEFKKPLAEGEAPPPRYMVILLVGLGIGGWFLSTYITELDAARTKALTKVTTLSTSLRDKTAMVNQLTMKVHRLEDLNENLKSEAAKDAIDYVRLSNENDRLRDTVNATNSKLSACLARTFTCEPYKPSLNLLSELDDMYED